MSSTVDDIVVAFLTTLEFHAVDTLIRSDGKLVPYPSLQVVRTTCFSSKVRMESK